MIIYNIKRVILGLNFSFDAILAMYINIIIIPPIKVINKIYLNHEFLDCCIIIIHEVTVCIISIDPKEIG